MYKLQKIMLNLCISLSCLQTANHQGNLMLKMFCGLVIPHSNFQAIKDSIDICRIRRGLQGKKMHMGGWGPEILYKISYLGRSDKQLEV